MKEFGKQLCVLNKFKCLVGVYINMRERCRSVIELKAASLK